MIYLYTAVLTPIEDGSGYYASVPDVPGCVTTGHDLSDTIDQITDALNGCLCVLEDEQLPISKATVQSEIEHSTDSICTLIRADTIAYRAKTDTRSVRKNVSIPAWMASLADKRGINCSQVLQEALRQRLV